MKSDTQRDYTERVLLVLVHIQKHLGESLNLDELARVACFSPFHFHRIFRGMVGESVKQHVRRLRLEQAAMALKSTERPVTDIAFGAGYQAHESFTRAFRRAFACSPSEFRTAAAVSPQIESPADVHLVPSGRAPSFQPIPFAEETMQIEVKHLAPTRVAFVRHFGPYREVGRAWETLCGWAGRRGLMGPNVRFLGASYDDPEITPADKLRYDACIIVDGSVEPEGDIGVQEIGGGRYAVATHEGPYETFSETYAQIYGGWFSRQEFDPGPSPCLEFYLNDPESTAPDDLRTDVWVPIQEGPTQP